MLDDSFAETVKIKSLHHLGTGGQAEVYKCQLTTSIDEEALCVDKCYRVYNNEQIAVDKFREMYREFRIGCCLRHIGIVEYKYFIRCDSPVKG